MGRTNAPRTSLPAIFAATFAVPLAAAAFFGPLTDIAGAAPVTITDAHGRAVEITDTGRVVSVGGSVTEILYALGLEDRIVAVDTTSVYPADALADKPNVGYLRALSPEGLLSTDPTLILAEDDAGPPEAVTILENASVPFVRVPGGTDATGVADKIRFIADVMGVSERGAEMADTIAADLAAVSDVIAQNDTRSKVLFILSLANGRVLAAGEGTSAAAIIEMAGAENALTGFSGYKQVNEEAIIEAAPEIVVMMARGDHAAGPDAVFAHPALTRTPAADHRRLVTMDGLYLLGFGPRIAHAVRDLSAMLYPDLPLPGLDNRPWAKASPSGTTQQ